MYVKFTFYYLFEEFRENKITSKQSPYLPCFHCYFCDTKKLKSLKHLIKNKRLVKFVCFFEAFFRITRIKLCRMNTLFPHNNNLHSAYKNYNYITLY